MYKATLLILFLVVNFFIAVNNFTAFADDALALFRKKINFNEIILKKSLQDVGIKFEIKENVVHIYYESPDGYKKKFETILTEKLHSYDVGSIGNTPKALVGLSNNYLIIVDGATGKKKEMKFDPVRDKKDTTIIISKFAGCSLKIGDVDGDGESEVVVTEVRESLGRGEIKRMDIVVYKYLGENGLQRIAEKKLKYSNVGSLELLKVNKDTVIVTEEGQETEGGFVVGYLINTSNKSLEQVFSGSPSSQFRRGKVLIPLIRKKYDIVFADDDGEIKLFILQNNKLVQVGKTEHIPARIRKIYKVVEIEKHDPMEKGYVFLTDAGAYILKEN